MICFHIKPERYRVIYTFWSSSLYSHNISYQERPILHHIQYTVGRHSNAAQFNTILHTTLQWLEQNVNQGLYSQKHPYLALMGMLLGVYCENFGDIDSIIPAPHHISWQLCCHGMWKISHNLNASENYNTARPNFHQIWIVGKKSFEKWAPTSQQTPHPNTTKTPRCKFSAYSWSVLYILTNWFLSFTGKLHCWH